MFNLPKVQPVLLLDGPAALDKPFASWLGTNTSSQKVRHLRKDPRICLYDADTTSLEGLTLQGTAAEVLAPVLCRIISNLEKSSEAQTRISRL